MANAWIVPPFAVTATGAFGTVQAGEQGHTLNDYVGVILRIACDYNGPTAFLYYDFDRDRVIDTIMLFGLVLSNPAISMGVTLVDAGGQVVHQSVGVMPVAGARGVGIWSLPAGISCRRLTISFAAPAAGATVQVSRVVVGKRIQMERNYGYGATFGVRDLGSLDYSARGVLLRRRGAKLRTVGLTFSSVRKDEVEQQVQPLLEQIGNTEMVALVTDPAVDARRPDRCYFGPLVGDLGTTRRNAAAYEAKANLVSGF